MTQNNGFIISTNNSNGSNGSNSGSSSSSTDNNNNDNYSQSIRIGFTNQSFTPFQTPSWPMSAISFDTQSSNTFNLSGGGSNTISYRDDQQSQPDQVYDPFIPPGSIYSRGFSMRYRNSTIRRRLFENK